jgi:hypothetical protein
MRDSESASANGILGVGPRQVIAVQVVERDSGGWQSPYSRFLPSIIGPKAAQSPPEPRPRYWLAPPPRPYARKQAGKIACKALRGAIKWRQFTLRLRVTVVRPQWATHCTAAGYRGPTPMGHRPRNWLAPPPRAYARKRAGKIACKALRGAVKRRQFFLRQRVTVVRPQWDPNGPTESGWQTAVRAFLHSFSPLTCAPGGGALVLLHDPGSLDPAVAGHAEALACQRPDEHAGELAIGFLPGDLGRDAALGKQGPDGQDLMGLSMMR